MRFDQLNRARVQDAVGGAAAARPLAGARGTAEEKSIAVGPLVTWRPDGRDPTSVGRPTSLRSGRARLRRRPEPRLRAAIGRRAPRGDSTTSQPSCRGRPCGCHRHIRLSRSAGRQKARRETYRIVIGAAGYPVATGLVDGVARARRQHHRRDGTVDRARRQAPRNLKGRGAGAGARGHAVERRRSRHDAALPPAAEDAASLLGIKVQTLGVREPDDFVASPSPR